MSLIIRSILFNQIIFEINEEKNISKDRPRSFLIEISKISVTNTRTNSGVSSKSNLAKMINIYQMKNLFLSDNFPSKSSDFHVITDKFINHVQGYSFYTYIFVMYFFIYYS